MIVSSVLLVAFGVDGLLAIGALTRLARLDSVTLVVIEGVGTAGGLCQNMIG